MFALNGNLKRNSLKIRAKITRRGLAVSRIFPYHAEKNQEALIFTLDERLPLAEARARHGRCRELLVKLIPRAGGLLVTGSPNIYYMTGTSANGLAWFSLAGNPVLAVRKGLDRAKLESPIDSFGPFRSFKVLAGIFADAGSPLTGSVAVDQAGVSWEQGRMLAERLPGTELISGDAILARSRALKTEWELAKMRESCARLSLSLAELTPRLRHGMSEYAVGRLLWDIMLSHGHAGLFPTGMHGSIVQLGHICAGDNGNYPSAYDGPLGIRGAHPSSPVMGNAESLWDKGKILAVDTGFNFEGYISDKTRLYFAGVADEMPAIVRKAQDAAMLIAARTAEALKPGAIPAEIYALSLDIAQKTGFAEHYMGAGNNQVRFLGHGIGLTVSEWPIFARGFSEPLQPGMTVALEPKIALPGIAMVGVENTYEITETGANSLTDDLNDIVCV